MTAIAPTAVVHKDARIGQNTSIGPGCVIEADVHLGDDCELVANCLVCSGTRLGNANRLFAGVVLGEAPQIHGQPRSAPGHLTIGHKNTFREYVTIHRGSHHGGGTTSIGNNNYLMAYCHLGHDVEMENNVTMANCCHISGHSRIENNVWLSGCSGTHQFVTVGRFAYTSGFAKLAADVPPFLKVSGTEHVSVRAVNLIALQRNGFSPESIDAIRHAHRVLYRRKNAATLAQAIEELQQQTPLDENVAYLLDFIKRSMQHRLGRYREQFR